MAAGPDVDAEVTLITEHIEKIAPFGRWIQMSAFHVALSTGDKSHVLAVLERFPNPKVRTRFVHTLVEYRCMQDERPRPTCGSTHRATKVIPVRPCTEHVLPQIGFRLPGETRMENQLFCLPLALAAYGGDPDIVRCLLDYGADPKQADPDDNNIGHALVYLSIKHPERALRVYEALVQYLDTDVMVAVLLAENKQALLPLDLAADFCLPGIMLAILNTDGIYRHVQRHCGTHLHVLYDVTRYEDICRPSILDYLLHMSEMDVRRTDKVQLLQREPLASWIKAKHKDYKLFIYLWLMQWLMYLALYLLSYRYVSYHGHPPFVLSVLLLLVSICAMTSEVFNIYPQIDKIQLYWRNVKLGRYPLSHGVVYRVSQILYAVLVAVTSTLYLLEVHQSHPILMMNLNVCDVILGFLAILYFAQLSARVGHMLTIIEKMITVTFFFILIPLMLFTALALSLNLLHSATQESTLDGHLSNTTETPTAPPGGAHQSSLAVARRPFRGVFSSAYETLLLMLLIKVPDSMYFTESVTPRAAVTLYILGILVITIVTLNMLIALMTRRVEEINAHKHSIILLETLAMVLFIEHKIKSLYLYRSIYDLVTSCRHRRGHRDNILCKDGKLYISVVECSP